MDYCKTCGRSDVKLYCEETNRENIFCGELCQAKTYQGDIENPDKLKIRVITWNMGDNNKNVLEWTDELRYQWNLITDQDYDILFLTVQEDKNIGTFGKAVENQIGRNYNVYSESTRVLPTLKFSLKSYVFVRRQLSPRFDDISKKSVCLQTVCTKATAGLSLVYNDDIQLIFMGSHLPVVTKKADLGFEERRAAVKKSLEKVFNPLRDSSKRQFAAFWAGDLNFRKLNGEGDQLDRARRQGDFGNFKEQKTDFPPTCKMTTNRKECDRAQSDTSKIPVCYAEKRVPSYCDRILYDSEKLKLTQKGYFSYGDAMAIQKSDHNLVYADFEIKLF